MLTKIKICEVIFVKSSYYVMKDRKQLFPNRVAAITGGQDWQTNDQYQ